LQIPGADTLLRGQKELSTKKEFSKCK
jgi:hypothetical protein